MITLKIEDIMKQMGIDAKEYENWNKQTPPAYRALRHDHIRVPRRRKSTLMNRA